MKKIAFFAIGIVAILAFIEGFTPANLLSPSFMQKSEYATYPILKDGVESDSYEVTFIDDAYQATISYSPTGNFFMVDYDGLYVFDENGVETLSPDLTNAMYNPPFSSYFFSSTGVFDPSNSASAEETFVDVLNEKRTDAFTPKYWRINFERLYETADAVVYGKYDSGNSKFPAYFKTDAGWVVLYASFNNTQIKEDYDWGTTFPNYPAKFERMVLLKDPQTNTYAYFGQLDANGPLGNKEDGFTYPQGLGVEILSFRKASVSSEIVYTPIPISHKGPGVYEVKVGTETLNFQETAIRRVGSRASSNMNRFILPEQYFQNSNVSFLEFRPGNNIDTSGSDGLYIIRPKP